LDFLTKQGLRSLHYCEVLCNLCAENGETLQVINYEVGQKFEPHFDGFQRIATVLMYLYVNPL